MCNIKALAFTTQKLFTGLGISKSRPNSKVKNVEFMKGSVTSYRDTHVKNQSSHCSKVVSKVKVLKI